ncbi:anti-sigma factor [Bordetella hinzii]|uniref:anti-sigma factor family protein n=1 Tax=Bordetella hinzii TaxID=103855 RepID=UPI001C02BBA1|nr:anti-sigma factor [Bordetella hinzii]QWF48828.1 anti-sigma factor [Bordetella hinzii]
MKDDLIAPSAPIAEADLHALVDGQLPPERRDEVQAYLAGNETARRQVAQWVEQKRRLRAHLDGVLDEPLPLRLPLRAAPARGRGWALAAGLLIAVASGGAAWVARGALDARAQRSQVAQALDSGGFAQRAAVAHAVFAADMRRPVEVGADQEQAMVTWLTRRLGSPVRAPALGAAGYELVGGRVLPGGRGAVAQLMYSSASGQRLTLYLTHEAKGETAAFRYMQDGPVRVFYWREGSLGYALSGEVSREELLRLAQDVYRQLGPGLPAPEGALHRP